MNHEIIGRYARPTAINISTLITRWRSDKNGDSRDFTSSRCAAIGLGQSDIHLRLRSHSGFDRIPIFVEAANRIFALHSCHSNLTEACTRKHVLQAFRISQCE